jgi:iron-sulfur cluster repair protein YtfE (RIC family)
MTVHELFTADHVRLRKEIAAIQSALASKPGHLESLFLDFQKSARAHLRKEDEVYYPHVDAGKKLRDRELMHSLRNDHAAVVFALESLAIRLRKKVPLPEWKLKFDTMINVLLAHFDMEEQTLFPAVQSALPPAELKTLLDKVQALS